VPEQPPPDQPIKVEFESENAFRGTVVLLVYNAVQLAPQLIPGSELAIVPFPVPSFETSKV
jgi:hypothetical protein